MAWHGCRLLTAVTMKVMPTITPPHHIAKACARHGGVYGLVHEVVFSDCSNLVLALSTRRFNS